jgi:DNA-binding transcriptional MerR regulator
MLIGELASRTGVSERLLRYYERCGLLESGRHSNGYREYDESVVETVTAIRALLAAGLPTRIIRQVLPCADGRARLRACPGVLDALQAQLGVLDRRATELAEARTLLEKTIATVSLHRRSERSAVAIRARSAGSISN